MSESNSKILHNDFQLHDQRDAHELIPHLVTRPPSPEMGYEPLNSSVLNHTSEEYMDRSSYMEKLSINKVWEPDPFMILALGETER